VNERIHPSHARTSRLILFAFILLAAIPFGAGFYATDKLADNELASSYSVLFMFSLGMVGLIMFLRLQVGRCPECKSLISRLRLADNKTETMKLYCEKCSILWDTEIKVEENS
jgi:hypothetical protein